MSLKSREGEQTGEEKEYYLARKSHLFNLFSRITIRFTTMNTKFSVFNISNLQFQDLLCSLQAVFIEIFIAQADAEPVVGKLQFGALARLVVDHVQHGRPPVLF